MQNRASGRGVAFAAHETAFTHQSDTEFMQYRSLVGWRPSSKTWPRCASHRRHETAVRVMPKVLSVISTIFSFAIGAQKLGQPVPDSNFVSELNSAVSQQIQRYRPSSWRFQYAPVNGISVS